MFGQGWPRPWSGFNVGWSHGAASCELRLLARSFLTRVAATKDQPMLQLLVLRWKLMETQWNPYTILLQQGNYHPSSFCLGLRTCILFILSSHHAWVPWVWGQGRLTSTSLYLIQVEGCWSDMILPIPFAGSCLSMKQIATGSKVVKTKESRRRWFHIQQTPFPHRFCWK